MIGLVVLFVATYAITVGLYTRSGCGCPRQVTNGLPTADGTTVTIDLQELQSVKGGLIGNVTVAPGPDLLDPLTGGLKDDLTVAVHSAATPMRRTWTKGMVPGVVPVPLTITGDPSDYPFDHYHSGPITVDLLHGANPVPQRASVTFVDRLPGWKVDVATVGTKGVPAPYRIELGRSLSTAAFAAVLLAMLIALAAIGLFVAVQTLRDRRKFQPPMTTWYAAMVFAVMPLRNALPDTPPIGSWIDVTVTLWVVVALVNAMLIYIVCWWRHLRPEPTAPAAPDPTPAPVPASAG
ncbi:DUF4436 domain-containing protein [Mycobacterium saskatchewanense]|uniref:DUF4436 domain-containing protein n=1 Tax=Mycobacterium saskatchewanense TaxID=220927 RepID=A0AAJ3NRL1_9MYCO|nr:DUF4436 domain-containing protein [Mycobacterium saskatchewanense]ORW71965.1 hypothetical protein AWC23_11945 [Mycobacterium saskatchewanense]BBX65434.1 DUF4436 domain-containing protein [Mycobacterium saskatchewanense]